ncbi:MAG: hypothetical protein D4S01_10410 [Dehalococcoidia bacterium]|nr:MAG: hypothetical protein D4S01_10410 [Dehalococcoidia bacterium]
MKIVMKKWIQKKAALDRRYQQMDRLILNSEKAYESKNQEQYEAYEECIKYQQEKINEIIKEIREINSILQKERFNENNCSDIKERN